MMIFSTAVANARLQQFINAVDSGVAPGTLRLFSEQGHLLCAVPLEKPSFSKPVDRKISLRGAPLSNKAIGQGKAVRAAFFNGDGGVAVADDMTVGTDHESDLVLETCDFRIGDQVIINLMVIQE